MLSYAISKKKQFIRFQSFKLGLNKAMYIASNFFFILVCLEALAKIAQL